MPPKAKDAKKGLYKQGTLLKDIIPATVKQPPLEGRPIRIPEYAPTQQQINPYEPQPDFEDWPGDEAAANFDFGVDVQSGKAYVDPVKFSVPPSFKSNENQIIFWRRPKELVKTELAEGPMSVTSLKTVDKHFQRAGTTVEGELSEGRRSIFHEDTVFDKDDLEISLFDVYEREETAEEVTQRLKEIAEKAQQAKKKPAGKKEEVVDTNPQKIKDVRLSNINMREDVPAYAKWIASQLQVIKDRNIRDINSKKPIWTKVYPQKDGVPVFNPSGRYWVKLYYMGKEKKIDIDDRIPVIYGRSLFAKSVQESEIWPFIFTKALIKLNAARWNDESAKEIEVGDGSIMYALTGYVPETISLSQNYQEKLKIISSALNDRNYNTGDRYITCFCLPNHKPSLAANKVAKDTSIDSKQGKPSSKKERDSPRNQSSDSRGNSQDPDKSPGLSGPPKRREQHSSTTMSKSPRPDPIQTRKDDILREKVTNVIPGFAYSVVDLFENEGFNMVYALERTENDIKLRTDLQALNKVNTNKLTKEEKIEHRRQKKELASKITAEDNKRMELIKTPARRYRLFKLRSGVGKTSALNFDCAFSDKDITVAKTCILNKLSKPPNYDLYDVKMDDKSVTSSQVVVESQKILPLDDFSKIDNLREPLKRGTAGSWLLNEDLDRYFQYIQIFHDPTRFKYKETFLLPARADEELVSYDDKEVIVLEGDEEEKEEEKERDRDTTFQPFLYSFASSRAANMTIELKPALCLQKFDFQNFEIAYSYKTLNQPHDSDCLVLGNKNQVFRMQIVSPLSCYLWIAANLHFKLMSMADFLCTYEGYQLRNQPIDYPIIEKNRYHLFYKGIINPLNETTNLICRLKNSADLAMLRSVRIKLVELTNKTYKSEEDFSTGVVTLPLEQSFYAGKSMLTLESQKKYMLVVEGRMAETTNEGTMELDILFRAPDFTLETVEQVEPLEYMDKYFPTKYGVLFRERLFLNNEAQASFFVRISDVLGQSAQQTAQKGKKGDVPQVEEKDLTDMRTVKLELFRDNELVSFAFGQNKAVLSNVGLYPTNNKDEPRNYFLQASLDIREWPECKEENEQTSNLHWILKVHSSDTIAIFKDTFKEDNIKAIKKSWEDKEPGRADKAKTARKKFLILEKIKRGEHVEADELQLINEPRQRKNKEEEAKKDPKGKPQPKGKAPPPGKPGKKEEAPVEEKKEERPLPKSKDHVMNELCKFLTHMEQPRLLQEGTEDDEVAVRTEEERNELREKILLGREEAYGMHDRNKRAREKIKEILGNKKEQIQKDYKAAREDAKEKLVSLMKEREEFRKKDKDLKDKERTLIALCKQEKPVYDEVVKFITENAEQVDPALIKLLGKVKKNAYIQDKITRLTEAMTAYDITTITTLMDEIRAEEIDIDEKLYNDAEELIDMAEKNPTFIADKQKEAQKAAKGKKK